MEKMNMLMKRWMRYSLLIKDNLIPNYMISWIMGLYGITMKTLMMLLNKKYSNTNTDKMQMTRLHSKEDKVE